MPITIAYPTFTKCYVKWCISYVGFPRRTLYT